MYTSCLLIIIIYNYTGELYDQCKYRDMHHQIKHDSYDSCRDINIGHTSHPRCARCAEDFKTIENVRIKILKWREWNISNYEKGCCVSILKQSRRLSVRCLLQCQFCLCNCRSVPFVCGCYEFWVNFTVDYTTN